MGFIRAIKDRDYTSIKNKIFEDPKISLKAKGLLGFMFTKPDTWDFSVNGLKSQLKEGRDSISGALKELEDFGYLSRIEVRNEKGHFKDYDYWITDDPTTNLPNTENPSSGNQLQVSTNLSNDSIKVNTKESPKTLFSDDPPKKPKKEFSPQLREFTSQLAKQFPKDIVAKLTKSQKTKWVDTVDKLIRLDSFTNEQIEKSIKLGREDKFWRTNFLSINKLRQKNKDDVMYVDVFLALGDSYQNRKKETGGGNFVNSEMTEYDLL